MRRPSWGLRWLTQSPAGRLCRGRRPDCDDDDVGRMFGTILGEHRAYAAAAGVGGERADPGVAQDAHALARVLTLIEPRHLRAGHAVHDPLRHFEYRHLEPEPARGGGHLQPDVAAADAHHAPPRGAPGAAA